MGSIDNMKMTVKEETKKDFAKKVKKQKRDKIPEIRMESKIKTEKMPDEMSERNVMKKKKRKIALNTDVTDDPNGDEVCKKKKKLVKNDRQPEIADVLLTEEPVKDKKKKKIKNKSMQTESIVEKVKMEKVENYVLDNLQEKKKSKKAKKVKKQIAVMDTETIKKKDKKKETKQPAEEEDICIIETETTKKPKKNKLAENEIKMECSKSDQIEHFKVKKTKDKCRAEVKTEKTHKIKKKKSNNAKEEIEEKDTIQVKKKKQKKKSEGEMDMVVDSIKCKKEKDIVELSENSEPKKKKKKKPLEENDKVPSIHDSESNTMSKDKQKKCSKKRENKTDSEADAGSKKNKKKKIKQEPHDLEEPSQKEVVFLSEKTGNTDEVNINKERRQALQMEIDQASQPQKPAKPSGLGQWGTAEFGSSEQQQKFLRLMGGFKKGFQPASSSGGGGNMALGRGAQQQLQQGLLGEFERAHSRRMDSGSRGAGLGFAAPSKKKFSIDANTTRSIRFDD